MKLTPTQAKQYITVSMDTFYKAMKRGDLSYEESESGRKIEFSELQRWHEQNYGALHKPNEQTSESVSPDIRSDKRAASGKSSAADGETALLKMQLEMMDEERKREREQLRDQIESLQQTLAKAQEQQTRLTALLTDQRQDKDRKQKEEQAHLIKELRIGQARLRQELQEVREQKGFLARWLGAGGRNKKPQTRARRQAPQKQTSP